MVIAALSQDMGAMQGHDEYESRAVFTDKEDNVHWYSRLQWVDVHHRPSKFGLSLRSQSITPSFNNSHISFGSSNMTPGSTTACVLYVELNAR